MEEELLKTLIIPVCLLLWFGIGLFFGRFSGWNTLAQRFPDATASIQKKYRFRSLGIGWSRYNNCVTFSISPRGIHISLLTIFLIGHHPILLPWREIAKIEKGMFSTRITLSTKGKPTEITVSTTVIDDAASKGYLSKAD